MPFNKFAEDAAKFSQEANDILKEIHRARDEEELEDAKILYKRYGNQLTKEEKEEISKAYLVKKYAIKRVSQSKGAKLVQSFIEWMRNEYGASGKRESLIHENWADVHLWIPFYEGVDNRAAFDKTVEEFCDKNGCSYELQNMAPSASSPQLFPKIISLKYPYIKEYEDFAKQPDKFQLAKKLYKRNWNQEFDPNDPDAVEDIVLLYNSYMDEMREWAEVVVRLMWEE